MVVSKVVIRGLKEESELNGPLAGCKILELGGIGPAPFGAMILAELGAEVIRIDSPDSERTRRLPLQQDMLNRGKKSLVLDLKRPKAVEAVLHIAQGADVFIESFRPGVAERLGVGPEQLLAVNQQIIYARMTGWGQTGPRSRTAGHDINYISLTGALHAIGAEAPQIPLNLVGDFGGGSAYLVIGILAAIIERKANGRGQVIDAAVVDGATHLMTYFYSLANAHKWKDTRESNLLDGGAPFYAVYATADRKHMAVGAIEAKFFQELLRLLDLPEKSVDPKRQNDISYWPHMRQVFTDAFRKKTRSEWEAVFNGSDACVSPVLSMSEAAQASHMAARNILLRQGDAHIPAPAPRFSRHLGRPGRLAPVFGQHTSEILAQHGLPSRDLISAGIAVQASCVDALLPRRQSRSSR